MHQKPKSIAEDGTIRARKYFGYTPRTDLQLDQKRQSTPYYGMTPMIIRIHFSYTFALSRIFYTLATGHDLPVRET